MISCNQFCDLYWINYVSLEKEFLQICRYVTLCEENYETYSSAYLKLLLEIGSEVDIALKEYCKTSDSDFNGYNIAHYRECILKHEQSFFNQIVDVNEGMMLLNPWSNKDEKGEYISPFWWDVYNKCKHNRTHKGTIEEKTKEYYKFANLKYTLNALAGVYQTYAFMYKRLADAEGERIKVCLPGSRMFKLFGGMWDSIEFYKDIAFHVENDGYLYYETGKFPWW